MSDYAKVEEKARLYDLAVEQGLIPPDYTGEPPATTRGAQHQGQQRTGEHERERR